jgi:hypothetical protein
MTRRKLCGGCKNGTRRSSVYVVVCVAVVIIPLRGSFLLLAFYYMWMCGEGVRRLNE